MTRRKSTFPCGHKGYGKVCHHCEQKQLAKEKEVLAIEEKRIQKQEWDALFAQDLIDLRGLPDYVVIKARAIIAGLIDQKSYRQFNGKRMKHNRLVVSIPVTRNYRMLCEDCGNSVLPQKVLSHEDYNVCKPGSS
jgi:DNA-directed RNA polymerase subunit RPC12/RpoP